MRPYGRKWTDRIHTGRLPSPPTDCGSSTIDNYYYPLM